MLGNGRGGDLINGEESVRNKKVWLCGEGTGDRVPGV